MKILEMLSYQRPAGSASEAEFLERFVLPLKPYLLSGNLVIVVPGDPDTLFSCHTDTVHKNSARQKVCYDEPLDMAYKDDKQPLGGDDTAGVWLLIEMIELGIPGTYIFHYGEERGCIGSKLLAAEHPEFLKQFKRAIAFDRRGTTSVITHQMHDRCCSDTFAKALAAQLPSYELDDTGLYTDTASYMELIPECTNLSVGYDHEHGPEEYLDLSHLAWLREAVQSVQWHLLPVERDPTTQPKWWEADEEYLASRDPKALTWSDINQLVAIGDDEIGDFDDAEMMVKYDPKLAARVLYAYVMDRYEYPEAPANDPLAEEEEVVAN